MTRDQLRAAIAHEIQRDVYPVRAGCSTTCRYPAVCPPCVYDTGREHHPGTLAGHLRFAAWTGRPLQPIVQRGLPRYDHGEVPR